MSDPWSRGRANNNGQHSPFFFSSDLLSPTCESQSETLPKAIYSLLDQVDPAAWSSENEPTISHFRQRAGCPKHCNPCPRVLCRYAALREKVSRTIHRLLSHEDLSSLFSSSSIVVFIWVMVEVIIADYAVEPAFKVQEPNGACS